MKQKLPVQTVRLFMLLFAGIIICSSQSKLLAANNTEPSFSKAVFEDDKKPSKKGRSSKMQNSVKIVPGIIKKSMHVVARSGNEKEINFFVFDVDGVMVLNYKMKAGEKKTITGLKRGSYVYHVFCEDESISTGRMDFR